MRGPMHQAPTGSIARAAHLIDVLAQTPDGLGLAQIVARSGYSKTTAFRVLASLREVGFVCQDPQNRRYLLGQRLTDIARLAARADVAIGAAPGMARLAELSGDTVFLSVPEGAAAICIKRVTGEFPIRTLTLAEGDTRPLGVGSGSLALYCAMSRDRRAAVCAANHAWMAEYAMTKDDLEDGCAAARTAGYAFNPGRVVQGTSAVAVPVVTKDGRLVAALAIGAIDTRMGQERITGVLVPALKQEAARLAIQMDELQQD